MDVYSETYPEHLTIVQSGGAGEAVEELSDLDTDQLRDRIADMFNRQSGGRRKKRSSSKKAGSKKKKSSAKKAGSKKKSSAKKAGSKKKSSRRKASSMKGGKRQINSALTHWLRLVDKIATDYKKKGKSRKEAMKTAKKVKDTVLAKNPSLKSDFGKLVDAAIRHFEEK